MSNDGVRGETVEPLDEAEERRRELAPKIAEWTAEYGPFEWIDSWLIQRDWNPAFMEEGVSSRTKGAIGVYLAGSEGEAVAGFYWFRNLRQAAEALILALPVVFDWDDEESLPDRLELFRLACAAPPTNPAEDAPWPRVVDLLEETAQTTVCAIGARADFCESPAPVFAELRSAWRRSFERSREGGGMPIPSRQQAEFFQFLRSQEIDF